MPIGAPPRHRATRNVGRNSLRRICSPSCMASLNRESAEMKVFSMGCTIAAHIVPQAPACSSGIEREILAELPVNWAMRHEAAQPAEQFRARADRSAQSIRRLDGADDFLRDDVSVWRLVEAVRNRAGNA